MTSAALPVSARPPLVLDNPATIANSRKFLIFGVMAFGQFMALLDIQIVAASLNDVQAGLSAAPDEISWVQTAYLMAELVMIPFSAYLTQALSTRWLFALSAAMFTLSSVLCGIAWSIQSMIAFRVLQGFTGGAMVPLVFGVGFTLFEGKQRAMIPAILGMVSVLAPTLGPTVGGLITDHAGWRWIFFVNVAPGLMVTFAALALIRVDRPNFAMFKRIDFVHLIAMAVFLAGLQYVLEEGPKNDWFSDTRITTAAWASLVAFVLFLERSFYSTSPIVNLSPFKKPSFAFACLFSLVIGFGIYASTYLVPIYLGRVRGYTSLDIGLTVVVVGCAQLFSVIVAARLSQVLDRRIMITAGLSLFALSLWMTSHVTADWGFAELFWPQVVRGFSLMLCIVPSVNMALSEFQGIELRYASGVFNLMRNLGGAIGIAVVNTWLADMTRIHAARFGETLGRIGTGAGETLAALTQRIVATQTPDVAQAQLMAQGLMAKVVGQQSLTLAFEDVFRIMCWMFLAALIMVPFSRAPAAAPQAAPVEAH